MMNVLVLFHSSWAFVMIRLGERRLECRTTYLGTSAISRDYRAST